MTFRNWKAVAKLTMSMGVVVLAVMGTPPSADAQIAPPVVDSPIRTLADGAGPSHIFWIGRDRRGTDVVGVIDPLYSAIRLYTVDPLAKLSDGGRIRAVGACTLPLDLRAWRIHQEKERIVIEGMPDASRAAEDSTLKTLRTSSYVIKRMLAGAIGPDQAAALAALPTTKWNPEDYPACGTWRSHKGKVGAGTKLVAARGKHHPSRTIILANDSHALAPREKLIVRTLDSNPNRLMSARELEPTTTRRVVMISEGQDSDDGMLRVRQRLLIFDRANQALVGEMRFDNAFLRKKMGDRQIAILPTGEALAIGNYHESGAKVFEIFSCGSIVDDASRGAPFCGRTSDAIAYRQTRDVMDVEPAPIPDHRITAASSNEGQGLDAKRMFALTEPLRTYKLKVDTSRMPEACRLIEGCYTGQMRDGKPLNYVPIRGIRLTFGKFERVGMPYAQAGVPDAIDPLFTASSATLSPALTNVQWGAEGLPGNLADYWKGDLGVDCSALVQVAWGGKDRVGASGEQLERMSTWSIQNFKDGLLCTSRLPGPEYLRAGDIVSLAVPGGTNHVMIFAKRLETETGNDLWLMLESSSSCGGVCWSTYDPSFFNGWGMYRAAGRSDFPCPQKTALRATPIPTDYEAWIAQVGSPVRVTEDERRRAF